MGNYGKPKKIVGRNFRANLLLYSCIILGCYALFNVNKFFIKDFERGYSATGTGYVLGIVAINFFILLFLLLPYILLKTFPKFYFYDEGFTRGKNGAFIYYEKMDYFFIPGLVKGKEFLEIRYTNNEGEWKAIPGQGYPTNGFDLFQQDFVNVNFPKAMRKLENNEVIEFLFNDPKKRIMAWGSRKYMKKKLDNALKIKITRESITFDDETYEWDKYKIFISLGSIVVQEKDGSPILVLGGNALIHRINLLEAIINTFGKN